MKTDAIKQLSILQVMDKLGVKYFRKGGGEYGIIENGEKTDGWSFNENKKIIKDFSKGRSDGDVFGFVKDYLGLDDHKTFIRFKENFMIEGDKNFIPKNSNIEKEYKPIKMVWDKLNELQDKQIEYLKSRLIDYEKIKDIVRDLKGGIGCLIYENGIARGINARTLSKEKNKRFFGLSGYSTKGIYIHNIDNQKDYIIVVEGLIDFLTIRQFESNVIGLKSANSGIDEVEKIAKGKRIILVPDNDEAGKETVKLFDKIDYSLFDLSIYGEYKDINDFHQTSGSEVIVEVLLDDSVQVAPINSVFKKFYEVQDRIKKFGKLGINGPFKKIYDLTSGVIPGKVYIIGASSNIGKSKFAYFHSQYFLNQGKKVLFINNEVDSSMCLGNVICAKENKAFKDFSSGYKPNENDYKNLMIVDYLYNINQIVEYIEVCDYDIIFIDYLQNIQANGSDYEKHSKIAREVQRVAIKTNKTIFALSQLSNSTGKQVGGGDWDFVSLKGSGEYTTNSDVIFVLRKGVEDGELEMKIIKNKFGRNGDEFAFDVDFKRNQFTLKSNVSVAF